MMNIPEPEISFIEDRLGKQNGKLLMLGISGSHQYGFESPDSDIDYRGLFQADTRRLLSIKGKPKDIIESPDRKVHDVELFEVDKEVAQTIKGNCNSYERLFANPIYITPEGREMVRLSAPLLNRNGIKGSYKGRAYHNYNKYICGKVTKDVEFDPLVEEWLDKEMTIREFLKRPVGFFHEEFERLKKYTRPVDKEPNKPTCKKYLYVYHGLMAGIYILDTGKIEFNIKTLNKLFKFPELDLLIEGKLRGRETLPSEVGLPLDDVEKRIKYLFLEIDRAHKESNLPDNADEEAVAKMNDYIVGLRLKDM